MDNLKEMDKLLETYDLPTEPVRNRKYALANHKYEIKTMFKIFQQTKVQDQMASQVNSIKHLE